MMVRQAGQTILYNSDDRTAMELATCLGNAYGVLADLTPNLHLNFKVLLDKLRSLTWRAR